MGESVRPYKDVSARCHSREGGNPVCVLRQLKRYSPPSRLKPRGNAATGAPFAGGVLDSRLRGNDGSIHARLADQTMPENVDKNTPQPLQKLPGLLSEAELAAQRQQRALRGLAAAKRVFDTKVA